jgi:hypothetical protein
MSAAVLGADHSIGSILERKKIIIITKKYNSKYDVSNKLYGKLTLVLQARRGVSMLSGSAKKKSFLKPQNEVVLLNIIHFA